MANQAHNEPVPRDQPPGSDGRVLPGTLPAAPTSRHVALQTEAERVVKMGSYLRESSGALFWSDGLFRLLGYPPGAVVPGDEALLSAVHPDDRARVRAGLVAELKGDVTELEFRLWDPERAGVRYVRASGRAFPAEEGFSHVVGALLDVTDAKHNEIALEEALAIANTAEVVAQIGSFMVRVEPMEMTWTEGLKALTGLDEPMADAVTHLQHVHPEDRDKQTRWWDRLVGERKCEPLSVRMLRPDGSIRHLHTQAAVIRSATDGVERVFGTTIDVTERVQLEQQLQHAAKMEAIGTLAAGVAHDFNNYLMVMESTLSMLADGAVDEERDELFDAGREALSRCTDLTRQLLTFARRQPFCPTTVDLRDVVSSFRKLLVGVVGRRADLLITLGEEAVLANVDARHIERILTNLAVNAADSIHEAGQGQGVIMLTVRAVTADVPQHLVPGEVAAGRYCCLVVEDNGGGISVEQLPHIFDPYYTTKAQGRGTGLGLSSVYGMSRQNGGQVTVCPLEHGARFTVWFPRAAGL